MRAFLLLSTLLMIALLAPTSAFAANPYVAAYPSFGSGTVSDINQFWLWENYTGTNTASISNAIGAVVSVAGAEQSCTNGVCTEVPSGWMYQAYSFAVSSSGWGGYSGSALEAEPNVWYQGTLEAYQLHDLGSVGSIAYLYVTVFFESGDIVFYYEAHLTSGSTVSWQYSFSESQYSDPDNSFLVGTVSSGSCPDGTAEYFQVGVEAQGTGDAGWAINYNVEGSGTVGWTQASGGTLYQWGRAADSGTVTQGEDDCLEPLGSKYLSIGGDNLVSSNAYYYDLNHEYPSGVVNWYYNSGSTIPDQTPLWPSPSLDGANDSRAPSTTSVSTMLTTSNSNDLVYVACLIKPTTQSATVSSVSVSSSGLAYTQRASVEEDANSGDILYAYSFYAVSADTLSSENVKCSATLSSGSANMVVFVWGISGADTSSPFDSNSGSPDSWTCDSVMVTTALNCLSFTTKNPDDMIVGVFGQLGPGTTFTNAAGYTTAAYNDGGPSGVAIYQVVSSAGTYTPSVTSYNSGAPAGAVYVAIGDAIVAASPPPCSGCSEQ